MKYKNLMAKALYDNVPEAPEELAFRKGDILTVIEQNTGGLQGWWLCSLHGRQGIAPGNRLNLLLGPTFESSLAPPHSLACQQSPHLSQGIYQVPSTQGQPTSQVPPTLDVYQVPPTLDVYQVPQRSTLAVDSVPSRVLTTPRPGQACIHNSAHSSSQSLYDVPPLRTQAMYDIPPTKQLGKSSQGQSLYDIPPSSQGVYSVAPSRSTGALDEGDYDFPQPHKQLTEGIYDVPPAFLSKSAQCSQSNYDFPPSSEPCVASGNEGSSVYDVPASQFSAMASQDLYDVPRGMRAQQWECERGSGVYDVPAPDSRALASVTDGVRRLSFSSTGSSMSTSSSSVGSPAEGRLALDLDSALQRLGHLQLGLDASVSALQGLATSLCGRTPGEVRGALGHVRTALAELLAFGRAAVSGTAGLSDPPLQAKLRRQLQRLEDAQQVLQQTHRSLESSGWSPSALAPGTGQQGKGSELDRAVMVSRALPDDVRHLASTIGGSAELLFRKTPVEGVVHPFTCSQPEEDGSSSQTKPFPVTQDREKCVRSWMEDYDYVHLQGKEEFERHQQELLEKENIANQSRIRLGQDQLNQFKKLEQEVIKPVENDITQWISHQQSTGSSSPSDSSSTLFVGGGGHLCGRDQQLLTFYAEQCEQHFVSLLNAVDAFFGCVAAGQPPRIFVAHAKFVILGAHKLVFIGDTLSRQAASSDVAGRVTDSSNVLCELLKSVVASTKSAALCYPNTAAVQDMVDRVTHLSHQAQQFKMQLLHMATF